MSPYKHNFTNHFCSDATGFGVALILEVVAMFILQYLGYLSCIHNSYSVSPQYSADLYSRPAVILLSTGCAMGAITFPLSIFVGGCLAIFSNPPFFPGESAVPKKKSSGCRGGGKP